MSLGFIVYNTLGIGDSLAWSPLYLLKRLLAKASVALPQNTPLPVKLA